MQPLVLALLLVAPALAPSRDADELATKLRELSAPTGEVRHDAERWLAANVGPTEVDRLASAVRAGDAEVQRRIRRVLSAVRGGLGMTALFLVQNDPLLADLGASALRDRISRWNPTAGERGAAGGELFESMGRMAQRSWPDTMRMPLDGTLEESCALLARRGRLPLGIAVDPAVADRRAAASVIELVGTWDEVVRGLRSAYGVGLDGHGIADGDLIGEGPAAFLRFCRRGREGKDTTAEVLIDWCRAFAARRDQREVELRPAAARALAASSWPEVLDWFEQGYLEERDDAALEGILRAASEGRMGREIGRAESIRGLIARAEEGLNAGSSGDPEFKRAIRIVDALTRMSGLGPEADDRATIVLEGWSAANERGKWLRLVLVEGMGLVGGKRVAREVLEDPASPTALLVPALRAWGVATIGRLDSDTACTLAAPERLVNVATGAESAAELARLLAHGEFKLPAGWLDPSGLPGGIGIYGRATVLGWLAARDKAVLVARHWLGLLEAIEAPDGDEALRSARFAEAIAPVVRARPSVMSAAWLEARGLAGEGKRALVDRSALLARAVPPARTQYVGDKLLTRPLGAESDLELLAVVAGSGYGQPADEARRALTALFQQALDSTQEPDEAAALLTALERALDDLRRRGLAMPGQPQGGLSRGLDVVWAGELRFLVRTKRSTPLGATLVSGWPPPDQNNVLDLVRADRRP